MEWFWRVLERVRFADSHRISTVLQCISSFAGTSYKKLQDIAITCFISCSFTSVFTLADIIFYRFSKLGSKLSKKAIFLPNFPFLMDSPKPSHSLNDQNPLSMTKVLCRCSLIPLGTTYQGSKQICFKYPKNESLFLWFQISSG